MRHFRVAAAIAALAILGFVGRAYAVWHVAGGVAYTAGSPGSGNVNYNPTDPSNTGLDGAFQAGTDAAGNHTATVRISGCCLAPNCPEGMEFGVKIVAQIQVIGTTGSWTKTHTGMKCPLAGQCAYMTVTRNESTEWWSGPATQVNIQVTVICICCEGEVIIQDPDEFPWHWFDAEEFAPVS